MLKPGEKAVLANWWHYTGRAIIVGISTGVAIVAFPLALVIGFTTN